MTPSLTDEERDDVRFDPDDSGPSQAEGIEVEPTTGSQTAPRRRSRLGTTCGLVSFIYVLWYVGDLTVLNTSANRYNSTHRFYGNLGVRVVWSLVLLALVFHALNGLRLTLTDLAPRTARRDPLLRAIVAFLTFAIATPGAFLVLWPSIRFWFS